MANARIGFITEIALLSSNQILSEEIRAFSRHNLQINNTNGVDLRASLEDAVIKNG
jgi:hypothetical protein